MTEAEKSLQRVLLVLGMHRSGTSAVTGVLSLAGARLGASLMAGIEGNNARVVTDQDIVCLRIQGTHTGSASPKHDPSERVKLPEMNPYVRGLRIHTVPALQGTGIQVEGTFGLTLAQ